MEEEPKNALESVCAGCLNELNGEYVSALSQDWHSECFRCSACDVALSSWYFEKNGLLFCQSDYLAKYGEACQHCCQVITGPVMVAGEHRFHPECFACACCNSFIEDGDPYALVERSKLYCGVCYKQVMLALGGHATHAIHTVEIGPRSDASGRVRLAPCVRRRPTDAYAPRGVTIQELQRSQHGRATKLVHSVLRAALSFCIQLTCNRMDSSCGLISLHIGDRILEINGTPIRDQPIHEIERVLCCSDTVLQLTIEHDPESAHAKTYQRCKLSIDEPKVTMHASDARSRIERKIKKAEDVNSGRTVTPTQTDAPTQGQTKHSNIDVPVPQQTETQQHSPTSITPLDIPCDTTEVPRSRLFKRRVEESGGGSKGRQLRRRATPASPLLGDKERSSSMSQLLDVVECGGEEQASGVLCDLSRARSFRVEPPSTARVFRACDLLQGELLGCGFFGQVYKVTHRDTDEVMVLKQLYRVDEDAQKNFLKEVAVLRSLSHANVLHFIGVLYKDKRLHLVTEYVAGGTLRELLQDCSLSLGWELRARLARDIAAGLAYLHRMNVIHRDLNSHNCLVREDKTVIVADFGLARIVQGTGASYSMERRPRGSTGSAHRRKRYTVVGNPYWMAPEMMKGNVYDEKVDVFSFGIILCEIIGRVQADPDYLPRRSDFGLNEVVFREKFCQDCPEPLYRMAFLCCDLNPDKRPPFEVMELWLESLSAHLCLRGVVPADLLADILYYRGSAPPSECPSPEVGMSVPEPGPEQKRMRTADDAITVTKSKSGVTMEGSLQNSPDSPKFKRPQGLGPKCVSASQICQSQRPMVTVTKLSQSQNTLCNAPSGYIVRADGRNINITKVDDITEWLDPPTPKIKKRNSKDDENAIVQNERDKRKSTPMDGQRHFDSQEENLPPFLRNQSVEGLESDSKSDVGVPQTICRHFSIPDNCSDSTDGNKEIESEESDDETKSIKSFKGSSEMFHHRIVNDMEIDTREKKDEIEPMDIDLVDKSRNRVTDIIEKTRSVNEKCKETADTWYGGRKFEPALQKLKMKLESREKSMSPVLLRKDREHATNARKEIASLDKHCSVSDSIKRIQKKYGDASTNSNVEQKTQSFAKKLLSPKLGRLFLNRNSSSESYDGKITPDDSKSKIKSKFFVQTPASNPLTKSSYRIRPIEPNVANSNLKTNVRFDRSSSDKQNTKLIEECLCDSDIKLANLGKTMTPLFRRHVRTETNKFCDGRFSYRDNRTGGASRLFPVRNFDKFSTNRLTKLDEDKPTALARCDNSNDIPSLTNYLDRKRAQNNDELNEKVPLKENTIKSPTFDKKGMRNREKELAISRSNYVSLANLKINCKSPDALTKRKFVTRGSVSQSKAMPVESTVM